MAWSATSSKNQNSSSVAGTTLALTIAGANLASGDTIIVAIALDNIATVDGDTSVVSGLSATSITFTKLAEYTNSRGAGAGGATCALWAGAVTGTVNTGATITITHTSLTARAACYQGFTGGGGPFVVGTVQEAPVTAGDPPSQTVGSLLNREHLFIQACAHEATNTLTWTTVPASWTSFNNTSAQCGTSGGGATSNMTIRAAYRIATATSVTADPGASTTADLAAVMLALDNAIDSTSAASLATPTTAAAGAVKIDGTSAASLATPTLAATGAVKIDGTSAASLAAPTTAATGAVKIDGTSAASLPAPTTAAVGAVVIDGTSAASLPALASAASAALAIDGASDAALPALVSDARGDVVSGDAFDGVSAGVLPALVSAAAGAVVIDGASAASLPALLGAAVGHVRARPVAALPTRPLGAVVLATRPVAACTLATSPRGAVMLPTSPRAAVELPTRPLGSIVLPTQPATA